MGRVIENKRRRFPLLPVTWLALVAVGAAGCGGDTPGSLRQGLSDEPQPGDIDPAIQPRIAALPGAAGAMRQVVAFRSADGLTTDFVADELVIRPRDRDELGAFLARWGGTVIATDAAVPPPADSGIPWDPDSPLARPRRYLVRVDLSRAPADGNRTAASATLTYSAPAARRLLSIADAEKRAGLKVWPNIVGVPAGLPKFLYETVEGDQANAFDWIEFNQVPYGSTVVGAWQLLAERGYERNIDIAILDQGFWLDGNGLPLQGDQGTDFAGRPAQHDFIDDDGNAGGASTAPCSSGSCLWHGNHAAGVATGLVNNAGGAAGSGGLVAKPYLFRVDYAAFHTISGLITAAAWGAEIANMSYGGPCTHQETCEYYLEEVQSTLNIVTSVGLTVVAAAGNFNVDAYNTYPCALNHVICVGALADGSTNKATSSSYGGVVDIWAPGTVRVMNSGANPTQTIRVSGTSFAAPMVAGIIAMVEHVTPGLTTNQMLAHLQATGRSSPDGLVSTTVDAMNAVGAAMNWSIAPDNFEPNPASQPTPISTNGFIGLTLHEPFESDNYLLTAAGYSKLDVKLNYMRDVLGPISVSLTRIDQNPQQTPEGWTGTSHPQGSDHEVALLAPGSYRLTLLSSKPQLYDMLVLLLSAHVKPDAFEGNNSLETATELPEGTHKVTLHYPYDVDYYRFTVQVPPMIGAYHEFSVTHTDRPITVTLLEDVGGRGPKRIDQQVGTDANWQFSLDDNGRTFIVAVTGDETRYTLVNATGVDDGWLQEMILTEQFPFLDPLGPITQKFNGTEQWVAAAQTALVSGQVMLAGRGLRLELYNLDLDLLASGETPAASAGNAAVVTLSQDPATVDSTGLSLLRVSTALGAEIVAKQSTLMMLP